ncbi:hypothetical protein ASD11_14990 [Aeromicrobium sp. Root495]|nr:hypothetical protein ASD11_14990 [Aeromicrobium sp. Root495]
MAVSVGADKMGDLAEELDALAASVNALTGLEAARNARHLESLAVTLGIALYEQTGSLDAVSAVIRDHWSKD